MKSIIEEFYYGRFEPVGRIFTANSEAMEALREFNSLSDEFMKNLDINQQKKFEEVIEARARYNTVTEKAMFADGFRYGAKFIYDAFLGDKDN